MLSISAGMLEDFQQEIDKDGEIWIEFICISRIRLEFLVLHSVDVDVLNEGELVRYIPMICCR
jgi:hypothetical protein